MSLTSLSRDSDFMKLKRAPEQILHSNSAYKNTVKQQTLIRASNNKTVDNEESQKQASKISYRKIMQRSAKENVDNIQTRT